jgi:hypothetical protein
MRVVETYQLLREGLDDLRHLLHTLRIAYG